jgi:hypothetical protein
MQEKAHAGCQYGSSMGFFFYFSFHFKIRAELVITSTDPVLCTRAPITGFNFPVMVSVIAIKFRAMETLTEILVSE